MSDYDTDVYAWSLRQGALLRRLAAGERVNDADLDWGGQPYPQCDGTPDQTACLAGNRTTTWSASGVCSGILFTTREVFASYEPGTIALAIGAIGNAK